MQNEETFQIYIDEVEQNWKKTIPRFKEKELVEIFSPSQEMIYLKINEEKKNYRIQNKFIKVTLKKIYALNADAFSTWFGERMVESFFFPNLVSSNKHIERLKRILHFLRPLVERVDTQKMSLEKALQYPISEVARSHMELKTVGNKFSSLCPFHNEKHPSFYLYPETNSYYCFGCHESGNVINLTMHLYGVTFREALQMLQ